MTQQDLPMLIAYEGDLEGRRWVLDQERSTMGRASDCDIVLPKRQVSRYHAQIERIEFEDGENRGYVLHDLGSKNGTYVNGKQVHGEPHPLKDGDEIQIALCIKMGFIGADATLPLELNGAQRGLHIDPASRQVFIASYELTPPLSQAQYRLLKLLLDHAGEVVSRDEIVDAVWAEEAALGVSEQAIDALVYRLRDRIAAVDPDHDYIVTVRGYGFRLDNA